MTTPFVPDQILEARATELLARYVSKHPPVTRLPVPVERIVEDTLQLDLLWDVIPEQPGQTTLAGLDPSKRRVVFNDNRRTVFDETPGLYSTVLGHEGGHWEIHVDRAALSQPSLPGMDVAFECLYRKGGPGNSPRETQAHRFMSYLLLPWDLLGPAIKGVDLLTWRNLYQLRDAFGVTITVLTIRLQRLDLLYVADDRTLYPSQAEFEGQKRLLP